MKISYKGINEKVVTFLADGNIKCGDLVKVSSNNTVSVCVNGDIFDGIAVSSAGGLCSVQVAGCAEVKANAALSTGYMALAADSEGVTANDAGRMCTVVNYDSNEGLATIIF